jgi:L-ascorbate metabolism protein UlaG (beta-lactamase superfamily)
MGSRNLEELRQNCDSWYVIKDYIKNENLLTVKPDWKGTPIDENGRFINHEFPFKHDFIGLLKWQFGRNPQAAEKRNDTKRLEVLDPTNFLESENEGILWLGHASFFIRLNGRNMLLDPVFGTSPFLKRLVNVPSPIDKLPAIDYVLISHDHRDHADKSTVSQLSKRFPNAEFLVGLQMQDLINAWKISPNEVQTAGWYQQFNLQNDDLKITFVPVRHWSRRSLFDVNKRLWGGFVIQTQTATIYFGGDTGYGGHFKELCEIFPQIDYFIVGIGAYSPRWFMKPVHNSPADALQAFLDSKAKYLIPMHFGTFDLTNEPPSEPLRLLKAEAEKFGVLEKIKDLRINESLDF